MIRSAAFLIPVLILAGCANTQSSTPPTISGCKTWEQEVGDPALVPVSVLSPELAKILGVGGVSSFRSASGMAGIQTVVYNCSDVDLALIMRARFNGQNGQSEPPSGWKKVFLAPRAQETFTELAVSANTTALAVDIYDANRGQSQFAPGQSYSAPKPPESSNQDDILHMK